MFFAQLTNELWKLFGKKRTYIGFGAFVLVQAAMLIIFRYTHWQSHFQEMLANNGYLASEYISALTVALVMVSPQALLLMPLYVALVGGDLVAKEVEDGTMRMILSRPISRVRLLSVKWLGGIIFAAVLVLALGAAALVAARILFPWKGLFVLGHLPSGSPMFGIFPAAQGLVLYSLSHLFMVTNAVTMLSIAFMFSSFNMKPAAATILALSYLFMNMVMQHIPFFEPYQNWFITHHFEAWFLIFQNPAPWPQIIQSEITLAAISTTAFIAGATGFQMRDIKS
ncbi:MAG TPA: ABC transporter permease subunit [Verrucomicrobiae bacterium]|jgi:ABC-2 type transport system permease protein|nr:ABC transporter permease subunit [Verrucomicrobiae bacterium]